MAGGGGGGGCEMFLIGVGRRLDVAHILWGGG